MKPVLTHLALGVRDIGRTIAFYERHAKLHVVHDRNDNGVRVVWLSEDAEDPHFVLVLFAIPGAVSPAPSTLQHLGFAVASRAEVDAAASAARADGVLMSEPCYAGPIVGYFCIVQDPDGNQVEFSYGQPINPREIAGARRE
jgi:catechol 2,3-dioxygenase-like lactoylglutathione lyase family enzyme